MDNIYRSFYTKNNYITKYMVDILNPIPTDVILEPCGGDGAFIDALLDFNSDLRIDTCDLNDKAYEKLTHKYSSNNNISIRHTDTLIDKTFDEYSINGHYNKIIGNPPYGGWQEPEKRNELKKKYNGFYVKETYSLFLLRCLSMLKINGQLSFIIPDTFLFLHNHTSLRSYVLQNTKIKEILIFPSKFFPGVSFGYSNLSIITLEKSETSSLSLNNTFRVIKGLKKDQDIERIRKRELDKFDVLEFTQQEIYDNEHHSFILDNGILSQLIANSQTKLGDIAECVTGIYTGNNLKYLGVLNPDVKNGKNYPVISEQDVYFEYNSINGIDEPYKYIPIVKGSSKRKYSRECDEWVIKWDKEAIESYHNEKKARFQNSSFYFKTGIALPMVKSSKINATILNNRVFDQSIVGVFPKENKYLNFLLGLLNSDISNKLIHLINPTANNSSNYLKEIPIVLPDEKKLDYITNLVNEVIENNNEDTHTEINEFYNKLYSI